MIILLKIFKKSRCLIVIIVEFFLEPSCDKIIKLSKSQKDIAVISSPDYPKPYPPNKTCIVNVTSPEGTNVNVLFLYFKLGNAVDSTCSGDRLEIRDKGNDIPRFVVCSSIAPMLNLTTSRETTFTFLTSNETAKIGDGMELILNACSTNTCLVKDNSETELWAQTKNSVYKAGTV